MSLIKETCIDFNDNIQSRHMPMRFFTLLSLCLFPMITLASENEKNIFDHTHTMFHKVLAKYVVTSKHQSSVRYHALKNSPIILRQYLEQVSNVSEKQYQGFSDDEKLAFLINAYNAFTLELIIQHYPVKSIKDIGGWFSSPWKMDFFYLFGEKHTLDDIEHQMIRKWFDEPRIHFALVCAARSCPPLKAVPYVASKLDRQLSEAAENFLNDSERNRLDSSSNTLYLSSIFKWYGSDFDTKYGSLKNYVSRFYGVDPDEVSVNYLTYDWSLNDAK